MAKLDYGFTETDKELFGLELRLHQLYGQAAREMEEKCNNYFERFAREDEAKRKLWEDGKITQKQYGEWRTRKMLTGQRWDDMRSVLATDAANYDKIAMSYVRDCAKNVYCVNMNYGTYALEKASGINTSFTLYNKDAIKVLMKDNPQLLPKYANPKVDIPLDKRWNMQHIQNAVAQGILQGESIPQVAKRLQEVTGMDERAAIRNARTAMTSAQNAGRLDAAKRMAAMGIACKKGWLATLDNVTRDSHVDVDGEVVDLDKNFSNGLQYPADGAGAPEEVYNCRCRLTTEYDKYKTNWADLSKRNTNKFGNMSYDEWKKAAHERVQAKKQKMLAKSQANLSPTERLTNSIAQAYETQRLMKRLTATPLNEIENFDECVDIQKLDTRTADVFADTLNKYIDEYDTSLRYVETMTLEEYMQRKNSFAYCYHNYETFDVTMKINPVKSGHYDKLTKRVRELADMGYSINVKAGKEAEYVATHEFAHTMIDMRTPLNEQRNWLKGDYGKVKQIRSEVEDVYSKYLAELKPLEAKQKAAELEWLTTFSEESAKKSQFYADKIKEIKLSNYSMVNSDEFMAEAFTNAKIGANQNKYSDMVMGILDKYFRKG